MNWSRERILATCFILLAVGSAIYLSAITLNYLNYYPGLSQLSTQIDAVSVMQGSNFSRIDTRITISNPSDYSGFTISEADSSTFFDSHTSSARLFNGTSLLQENLILGNPIPPHSTLNGNIVTNLNPTQAGDLAAYEKSQNGNVMANMTLTVQVSTFLTGPTGRVYISVSGDLPLLTS